MTFVVRILTRRIGARSVLSYTPCCYRVWDQCNVVQDYLTVYDGAATTDPVLVRLCGGDVVPDIVSSGPNMLLEFHTSPFDNPFHPVPLSYLPGFELEVQVRPLCLHESVRPAVLRFIYECMNQSVDFIICPNRVAISGVKNGYCCLQCSVNVMGRSVGFGLCNCVGGRQELKTRYSQNPIKRQGKSVDRNSRFYSI